MESLNYTYSNGKSRCETKASLPIAVVSGAALWTIFCKKVTSIKTWITIIADINTYKKDIKENGACRDRFSVKLLFYGSGMGILNV